MYMGSFEFIMRNCGNKEVKETVAKKKTRYIYRAYCTSYKCNGRSHRGLGTLKQVDEKIRMCPDCGHALYWHRVQVVEK